MKRDDLTRELAPLEPPPNLLALCDYESSARVPGIVLVPSVRRAVEAWTKQDARLMAALWPFALDRSHGLYAFWTLSTSDLKQAPIVYLGGEGFDNGVLAASFDEFLVYLCAGYDLPGLAEEKIDDDNPMLGRYRAWVASKLEVPAVVDVAAISARAASQHPDFEGWLSPP